MSPRAKDRLLWLVMAPCATGAAALVLLITAFVAARAGGALVEIGFVRWFTDAAWRPTAERFGIAPLIVGSLLVTFGAIALAGPLGVLVALFGRFWAPRPVATFQRHLIGLLAGIPSVVYGLWGLSALVPLLAAQEPPGTSLLAGILVLGVMVTPTMALAADAALRAVPREFLLAGAALGLRRRALAWRIAMPAARGGLATGGLLASARAIGETMAVVMVCGNVPAIPDGPFAPVRTLTANIALEMGYADPLHQSALFATGLALLLLLLLLALTIQASMRRGGS